MPKEITYDKSANYDVVVGWNPEGDMQLGLQTADRRALVTNLYGESDTLIAIGRAIEKRIDMNTPMFESQQQAEAFYAGLGRMVLDVVETSEIAINSDDRNGGYDSVWCNLSRSGCNRLIRNLRKAREAAFGRDE